MLLLLYRWRRTLALLSAYGNGADFDEGCSAPICIPQGLMSKDGGV